MDLEFVQERQREICDLADNKVWRDFISVFTIVEFRMKSLTAYRKVEDGAAEADWNKLFSDDNWNKAVERGQICTSLEYHSNHPCKKQYIRDGKFVFEHNTDCLKYERMVVSQSIRNLRNNIIHGGKYIYRLNDEGVTDKPSERETDLINHSLNILIWFLDNELSRNSPRD